ncbi:MAG: type II secretion system F family protein, partial [Candidatus Zixiibacteriota bacterium]
MPDIYTYRARTRSGLLSRGRIQAESPERAAAILAEQKLLPSEIKLAKDSRREGLFGFFKTKLYENLIIFTRNLSTLHRAGIPILRALAVIRIGADNGPFNRAIEKIRDSVKSGKSLSEAIADFPHLFPRIYTAAVAAGEASGSLERILDSLGSMLEKDLQLNRQIKSSVRYPAIVVGVLAL